MKVGDTVYFSQEECTVVAVLSDLLALEKVEYGFGGNTYRSIIWVKTDWVKEVPHD